MVCCNRAMSQSSLWTGVFHCAECKSSITVDNPREYSQCELCGCFYHRDFLRNVESGIGTADISVQLHCNGCAQREHPNDGGSSEEA